ncbi:hypothetical protein EI94DRAFT_1814657 [Lactarius quietus]|nr:hypothetical protein EI94DRAFT_1814657 [Lactarius quietus]
MRRAQSAACLGAGTTLKTRKGTHQLYVAPGEAHGEDSIEGRTGTRAVSVRLLDGELEAESRARINPQEVSLTIRSSYCGFVKRDDAEEVDKLLRSETGFSGGRKQVHSQLAEEARRLDGLRVYEYSLAKKRMIPIQHGLECAQEWGRCSVAEA